MSPSPHPPSPTDRLTSWFWSGDTLRSRRVSNIVLSGKVDVPEPPPRLRADWAREISSRMDLGPGDVEAMPLARTRTRWPEYARCVQAVLAWIDGLGLPGGLADADADVALMACRGARYHHDGEQYGSAAFCNLFLGEDNDQEVHFPNLGLRIPLTRGTVLLFDTCQPHGVIRRGAAGFDAEDFAPGPDVAQTAHSTHPALRTDITRVTQVFLTWELPIEDAAVLRRLDIALDIALDTEPPHMPQPDQEQLWLNGERVTVCPESGRFRPGTPDCVLATDEASAPTSDAMPEPSR